MQGTAPVELPEPYFEHTFFSFHFIFIHPIDQYIDIGYVKSQKQSYNIHTSSVSIHKRDLK
jgi:hypothetical protein